MAVSLVGTPAGAVSDGGNGGINEAAVTATPPSGCDCIVMLYAGFSDNQATGIDVGGTTHSTADVAAANGTQQVASIFVITTSDAAWPGTGSPVTFTSISNAPSNEQRRIGVCFFSGVDATTPVDDTGTQTGTTGTALSIALTTDADGYCLGVTGCYSGDPAAMAGDETEILGHRTSTTNMSCAMWADPSDGASTTLTNTLTGSSNFAFAALALNPATGGGGATPIPPRKQKLGSQFATIIASRLGGHIE